jgi:uncharacterized integral membrane protein
MRELGTDMARPDRDANRNRVPGGRRKTAQAIIGALLIVGLLLAIFVLQNTTDTEIEFLFWSASVPLAGALLLAAVLGGMFASLVVFVRQRQFRNALKAEQARQRAPAEAPSARDSRTGPG